MEKCYICKKPAQWEVKVDDELQFCHQAEQKPMCDEHKRYICQNQEPKPYIRRITQSLTEAYMDQTRVLTFARCGRCLSVFEDDVGMYGSLKCPNPECIGMALERGIESLDE